MKFVANPNRFIFFIGLGIVGFLYMFLYMILSKILLLIPAVLIWIIMSFYFARKNYVEFVILKNKFAIRCAGKKYDVDFADIDYIIESSSYTNFFREKRYLLKVRDNVNIDSKTFKIENKVFSKWISEHRDTFLIKKQMTFD